MPRTLYSDNLIKVNALLNDIDCGDCRVEGRIDSFSCKTVGDEKKRYNTLARSLEQEWDRQLAKTPSPQEYSLLSCSPLGPLSLASSRKMLFYLISTLNLSYPDYDFSGVRANHFRKEPVLAGVVNLVNTTLASAVPTYVSQRMGDEIWAALEAEICLSECSIYTYLPEESDPFLGQRRVWSFNYFFFNQRLKRIAFFCCYSTSKRMTTDGMDDSDDDNHECDESWESEAPQFDSSASFEME